VHVVDHVELHTADYEQAKRFYEQALAPLGVAVLMEVKSDRTGLGVAAGFGRGQKPSFWLAKTERTTASVHLAFVAESRAAVDAFYEAALAAGGRDNGPPGLCRNTVRATTPLSSSISTDTTSKQCTASPVDGDPRSAAFQKTNRASLLTRGLSGRFGETFSQRSCAYFFDFLRLRFFGAAFALRFALFAIVRLFLDLDVRRVSCAS